MSNEVLAILMQILKTILIDGAPYFYGALSLAIVGQFFKKRSEVQFLPIHEVFAAHQNMPLRSKFILVYPMIGSVVAAVKIASISTETKMAPLVGAFAFQLVLMVALLFIIFQKKFQFRFAYLGILVCLILFSLSSIAFFEFRYMAVSLIMISLILGLLLSLFGCLIYIFERSTRRVVEGRG